MLVLCRRKRSLKKKNSTKSGRTPKRTNSGRNDQKDDHTEIHFKSNYSMSNVMKIININETPECQRCFVFMIQFKNKGKIIFFLKFFY